MAVTLSISLSESNVNVVNNTSDVTAIVYAHSTYGSYYSSPRPGYLVLDGTRYDFSSPFAANVTTELYRTTRTILHDSTGVKTCAANAWFSTNVSSGDIVTNTSLVLTNIPRNSIVTAVNNTDDKDRAFSVAFTKYANYIHTVRLYTSGLTIRTISNITDSPISVTLTDAELLAIMEHWNVGGGKREQIGFELKTFSGSTQIGGSSIGVGYLDIKGNAAYDDGASVEIGVPYYDTGTAWKPCILKYDDGSAWK